MLFKRRPLTFLRAVVCGLIGGSLIGFIAYQASISAGAGLSSGQMSPIRFDPSWILFSVVAIFLGLVGGLLTSAASWIIARLLAGRAHSGHVNGAVLVLVAGVAGGVILAGYPVAMGAPSKIQIPFALLGGCGGMVTAFAAIRSSQWTRAPRSSE